MFPGGVEDTLVTLTGREPNTALLATLSGRDNDRFTFHSQLSQPTSCSSQKQEPFLPQKRGIYSSIDHTSDKLTTQTTTVPTDRFRTRASDSKFHCLYALYQSQTWFFVYSSGFIQFST